MGRHVSPNQYSSLAIRITMGTRDPALSVERQVFGALLHTTGRGITTHAARAKRKPIDVAIETYLDSQNGSNGYPWGGPAYVIDHDGKCYQIAPDDALTHHAGSQNRLAYLSGHWAAKCSGATLKAWQAQWGATHRHPYQLFPSRTPNRDYVGIEMVPCGSGFGEPMRPELLFTLDQHDSVAELCRDIGKRHELPDEWQKSSRLAGHEDVDILERMDSRGGWDPGHLRIDPYFDFTYVRERV